MLAWKIGLCGEQKLFCSITYGFSIAYYTHRIRKTLRTERKRQDEAKSITIIVFVNNLVSQITCNLSMRW